MTQHVLSLSYGKNSLACLGAIEQLGWPLDRIIHAEVWATDNIPAVEAGWTEAMCRKWCEENDLLSPIYTTATRGGCWFCHNQSVNQLRLLRETYPDLWALMLRWDADSPVTFSANGRTLHDYDLRFELEDSGIVPTGKRFRWADVLCHRQTPGQVSIEEVLCQ